MTMILPCSCPGTGPCLSVPSMGKLKTLLYWGHSLILYPHGQVFGAKAVPRGAWYRVFNKWWMHGGIRRKQPGWKSACAASLLFGVVGMMICLLTGSLSCIWGCLVGVLWGLLLGWLHHTRLMHPMVYIPLGHWTWATVSQTALFVDAKGGAQYLYRCHLTPA